MRSPSHHAAAPQGPSQNPLTRRLTSSIPTELGRTTTLQSGFYLYSNLLSSTIPTELGNLEQITASFRLDSNLLCDQVPTQVDDSEHHFTPPPHS